MESKFHLALPCKDIKATKTFYTSILGTEVGRETLKWIDINLFGNQITFTQSGKFNFEFKDYLFGKTKLPSFHFGVIVDIDVWGLLYTTLLKNKEVEVTTEVTFMKGNVGEHISFFITDPNGYCIEFKSFNDTNEVFMS